MGVAGHLLSMWYMVLLEFEGNLIRFAEDGVSFVTFCCYDLEAFLILMFLFSKPSERFIVFYASWKIDHFPICLYIYIFFQEVEECACVYIYICSYK